MISHSFSNLACSRSCYVTSRFCFCSPPRLLTTASFTPPSPLSLGSACSRSCFHFIFPQFSTYPTVKGLRANRSWWNRVTSRRPQCRPDMNCCLFLRQQLNTLGSESEEEEQLIYFCVFFSLPFRLPTSTRCYASDAKTRPAIREA